MHLPVYGRHFWNRYPWRWGWHRYPVNWYRWASVPLITSWCFRVNTQPVYYSYGDNIYYEGDNVYYENNVIASADEYAAQAQEIAAAVPDDVDTDDVEWLPLGIFSVMERDGDAEDATLFLQLAVNKDGIIAGTVQNTTTDDAFEVEGTVDKESQRAAWGPVGKPWPIMETGIYNLSENATDVLLHFEGGETQQWSLARLDEPENSSDEQ
ncbi:hypothetical protein SV7mr_52440 [Stieleria bergensis]|uniref:Uncharacterized protein n=1 Tax=Stieleria bergensis TaxID=2528025 RepID=A0A517T2U0_9BACT|nr:hypothetical protein SV7mr_52440 [Planctomycetes bacterium SV_7m_r]